MTEYGKNGRWRTARKVHRCDFNFGASSGGFCRHEIQIGERYYDTGELQGPQVAGGFATDRICSECAARIGYHDERVVGCSA